MLRIKIYFANRMVLGVVHMPYREQIPIDKGVDHTATFLMEGYRYISNRAERFQRNIFETRLLGGRKTICLIGKEAAEVFYDNEKFRRQGAAPKRVLKTLFGEDGVQALDDETHRNRKALFMSLMTKERLQDVKTIAKEQWQTAIKEWCHQNNVVLYDEAKKILTRTACIWAGVPLLEKDEEKITKQLSSLYEAGGAIGLRHWRGRVDRHNIEKWVEELITSVRNGRLQVAEDTALYHIAFHKELNGELLEPHIAGVELVNILRPIVAISVYIAFCALALHQFPYEREKLRQGNKEDYRMFVQEVRRYYPFFPMAVAKVRDDFLWNGHDFKKDTLVLLDLYGTNHHPDLWEKPRAFLPERFKDWDRSPFDFIPQGGGDYYTDHRCPGEWLTIDVMETSLDMLLNYMSYDVPEQNFKYSMTKMPSLPKSEMTLTNIKEV